MARKMQCRRCWVWFESNGTIFCSDDCYTKVKSGEQIWNPKEQFKSSSKAKKNKASLIAKKLKKPKTRIDSENRLKKLVKKNFVNPDPQRSKIIANLSKKLGKNTLEAQSAIRVVEKQVEKVVTRRAKKLVSNPEFYNTREWQSIRYQAIREYGRKCMACGKTDGEMHVDHIKPRSLYPELELKFDNLQILCRDCNLGKGNSDCIDWRPK